MEQRTIIKKILNFIYELCIMEFKVLGLRLNLFCVTACIMLGMFLSCHVLWSCITRSSKKQVKEGLEVMGSALGYNMSSGVKGSWGPGHHTDNIGQQLNTHQGPQVPLPPGQLFFFADNDFSAACCVPPFSGVSSSEGCACVTKEQVDYINMRGGNRTGPGNF